VRVYADTSFLVKLLVRERGTEEATAEYRRLGRPTLAFLPLHALEVENAIRLKTFHEKHSVSSRDRGNVSKHEIAALRRLDHLLSRGALIEAAADWDAACVRARKLSRQHTGTTGARSLDLLHLAFALEFESDILLSTDECQAKIAAAEGLKVVMVSD
jgi:predicted nucleic acid-binding protein